jgi:hypothetical protein
VDNATRQHSFRRHLLVPGGLSVSAAVLVDVCRPVPVWLVLGLRYLVGVFGCTVVALVDMVVPIESARTDLRAGPSSHDLGDGLAACRRPNVPFETFRLPTTGRIQRVGHGDQLSETQTQV